MAEVKIWETVTCAHTCCIKLLPPIKQYIEPTGQSMYSGPSGRYKPQWNVNFVQVFLLLNDVLKAY